MGLTLTYYSPPRLRARAAEETSGRDVDKVLSGSEKMLLTKRKKAFIISFLCC